MKFIIEVAGKSVVLDDAQLETIINVVSGAMHIDNRYVSGANGQPASYVKLLRPVDIMESVRVTPLTTTDYNALQFFTAQYDTK